MPIRSRLARVLAAVLLAGSGASLSHAQETPAPDRASKEIELRGIETNLKASEDEQRKIETDVEAIKLDRARLNQALLETTAKIQKTESDREEATARLDKANSDQTALEFSIGERRDRLASLLAGLQRMTRNPPPAVLVRPDDMAAAVRAASVLNTLIGDIKAEADSMSRDLAKISELKIAIAQERDGLAASAESLAVDKAKLDALVQARQSMLADRQGALAAERKRAEELAGQASNLKDLIDRMNGDAAAAEAADRAAAAAVESRAAARGGDLARLKPALPFSDMKGRVAFPVAGAPTKNFGDPDGFGGQEKGVSIAAPPSATVSTPIDAWVAYAGPYRSYGQLLILNAGEGYYLILAGMERIQVAVGQFVLAGEPVAAMGAARAGSAGIGAAQPVLYIELRKNDAVIDPNPWWAKSNLEKARG
jgi:septal ring factor EnvC (AmiA/AmiB activator)